MTTSMSKVIDLLPELTPSELAQLSALLSVRLAAAPKFIGPSKNKAGPSGSKTKKKKEKEKSAPKVSEYRDIPEYKEFKASEKALHSYLKGQEGEKRLLSHYVGKMSEFALLTQRQRLNIRTGVPQVVAGFLEARDCWFRTKGIHPPEEPASDNESPEGVDPEEEESPAAEGTSEAERAT